MQTIHLDISNKSVVPTVYAKQNDVGRKFAVILTNSGVPYIPAKGSVFSVWYKGASGEGNYTGIGDKSAFSLIGNKVEVEMIVQMLSTHGDGVLCLTLNSIDGNQISSWNIPYLCEIVPGAESEKAEEYYTAFSNAVANLQYPDASLSVSGKAADAKSTGDAIAKKVPTTRKINGKSLSADVELKASDVGAAPDGFGLGVGSYTNASTSYSTQAELDALTCNGFWAYRNHDVPLASADAKTKYVKGITIAYSENHETQIGWCVYSGTCIVRERDSGVWKDWEFVAPPMNKNVEYLTTERYQAQVVYTKLINCGQVASGQKTVTINLGATNLIRFSAQYVGNDGKLRLIPWLDPTSYPTHFIGVGVQNNNVYINAGTAYGDTDIGTLYLQVWYTKY